MEKLLDLETVEENADDAERVAAEAEENAEENQQTYTHKFAKPYEWNGKRYDTLTFDWMALDGEDHLEIESLILRKGQTLVTPAFTGEFLAGMAARACTERDEKGRPIFNDRTIKKMPLLDFQKITRKARDFLLSAGF